MVLLVGYQRARKAQAMRSAPVPEMDCEMASYHVSCGGLVCLVVQMGACHGQWATLEGTRAQLFVE